LVGTSQVLYAVIILLLVPFVKRCPVLPPILMNCPHTHNRNKYQAPRHKPQCYRVLHYMSNEDKHSELPKK
jgi:hypothetical protein